jgi:hypothetical protein
MPLFQAQVYPVQAPGVEGDFADHNTRTSVMAGPGGLVSHSEGIIVARFGWLEYSQIDPNSAPAIVRTKSTGGAPAGFVHREQQGLNTNFLGGSSMYVPGGFPITLHNEGAFWVLNRGSTYAQIGQKAFARLSDGAVLFGAAGSNPGAAAVTGSVAAATALAATGSISGNVLTLTAVSAGLAVPGATITGTGVAAGTKIVTQLTGATPGGVGTYAVSIGEQAVASTAIAGTYGVMTVTATGSGAIEPGDVLTGSGVVAGTTVTAMGPLYGLTGTGGNGTYAVDNATVVASTALTGTDAYETKWFATSAGAAGTIIKMSSWPLG